jgi:hypothetical protein
MVTICMRLLITVRLQSIKPIALIEICEYIFKLIEVVQENEKS